MMMNEQNTSFYPELTKLLKEIIDDIAKDILKEGQPIIIVGDYSWYKETLSLLAKQVNLCDSCILLLENGMEQEAYLLARSQFNNMLWIKYICDDSGDEHVKEYFYQPHISQILTNKNLKKMLDEFEDSLDERFDKTSMISSLDNNIAANKSVLQQEGIAVKPKSIAELSKQDGVLFGTYVTLYNEGSKFEHSDISKTRRYRREIIDGYTDDQVFMIDLGTSNKEEWLTVFRYSLQSVFFAFESLWRRITTQEDHLFVDTTLSKAAYAKQDLKKILLKLGTCMDMLEKEE